LNIDSPDFLGALASQGSREICSKSIFSFLEALMTSRALLLLTSGFLAANGACSDSVGVAPGTASGEVLVGEAAAHQAVNLLLDGRTVPLAKDAPAGSLAFTLKHLATGTHTLLAWADADGDGSFSTLADLASSQTSFDLDLADPLRASVDGLKLYLAQSKPGLCTLTGKITFPSPQPYLSLGVAALDLRALTSLDLLTILSDLWSGYATLTDDTRLEYRYLIKDLKPATYLVIPAVSGIGGGLSVSLIADLKSQLQCQADQTTGRDFAFGDVAISGTVTLVPATPPTASYAWGVVAARGLSPSTLTAQVVLMPTLLLGTAAELKGSFGGAALRDNQSFALRAFTSLDTTDPLTASLSWGLNPLSSELPQATVKATPPRVVANITAKIETDAGTNAGAADAGTDAGSEDADIDAGSEDADTDASTADAGTDASSEDADTDAGTAEDAGP
jgi:hypothetical protein